MDMGAPVGNIARLVGLLLLLAAIPAILQAKRMRTPGLLLWVILVFYLWLCCTYFWTIDSKATLEYVRGGFQTIMVAWLVWEFAESAEDLRALLRSYVAGSWVLAVLSLANLASADAIAAGKIRFVAAGQDPNDVARFLDLGFPLAALLLNSESRWAGRLLALGYLPLGLVAMVLTASRGGFLAGVVALAGCGLLLSRSHPKEVLAGVFSLPAIAVSLWFTVPHETLERLATIPAQLQGGDLNQRLNIWTAGWHAFVRAPLFGTGAGSFVSAAGLAPLDTAHNTALSIAVDGGLFGLFLAVGVLVLSARSVMKAPGSVRVAMATALLVWMTTSLVATVEDSRTTWLLLALIALVGRLAVEEPERLAACFPDPAPSPKLAVASAL
jgi:putative inorganic carbon (HCO3(-)) transporter